ncbi:hypothetical protein Ae201684P_005325 [Aphanomyces euteiches]|nr:hypothetical protein Ae201684P_005325 [Aphanomyces euteiches]
MARGQNFENASISELNAAIDVTAEKIRLLRADKKNMAEVALEVKHLVTLRRLLKEKKESGVEDVETTSNQEAPQKEVTPEAAPAVETKVADVKVTESAPEEAKVEPPVVPAVKENNDESAKKIADLEAQVASITAKLNQATVRNGSLQDELTRQVQKYDIEITTSNNMQQRLQNDMKKLVQDKLEFERTLKQVKEAHAEAVVGTEKALKTAQDDLAKKTQTVDELKASEAAFHKKIDDLTAQTESTNAKLAQAGKDLEAAQHDAKASNEKLQVALGELERERVKFAEELEAQKKLHTRLLEDARRFSLERQSSVDELKASTSEAESLQASLSAAVAAQQSLQESVASLKAELESTQKQLTTATKESELQKKELTRFAEAQAAWTKEKLTLESHVAAHDETKDKLAELQAHNDELRSSIEEASSTSEALEAKLAQLHASQAKLAAEKDELLHHVTQTEQDKAKLVQIQEENEQLQRAINDMSKASDNVHGKVDTLKANLAKLEEEKAALLHHAATAKSLEAAIAQLTLENTHLRTSLTTSAVQTMSQSVQIAESKLQDTQYLMTTEMLRVASLEKQLAKAQGDLNAVAAEHKKALDAKDAEYKKAAKDLQAAQIALNDLARTTDKSSTSVAAKENEIKAAKATVASLRAQLTEAQAEAAAAQQALKRVETEVKSAAKSDKEDAARLRKENGKLADIISQLRKDATGVSNAQGAIQSLESQRSILIVVLVALIAVLVASKSGLL